jgi:SAM-dependent methyltransferase
VITRPPSGDAEPTGDRLPSDHVLELAFEVGPRGTFTRLNAVRSTGETERQRVHGIELPFDDDSFLRAVCLHGLQLLADRGRALEEMRRVLVRSGRVEIAVLGPIERNPPFAELAASLERHSGARGAAAVRWLFSMPEPDDLRGVLAAAAFEDIRTDVVRISARSRSIVAFLSRSGVDPWDMPETAHLERALGLRVDQDGLLITTETIIGRARRG